MKILVLTDDVVAETMAGSAVRAWELAASLENAGHHVRLAGGPGSRAPREGGPTVVGTPSWSWAEAVIAPPWSLPPRAFLPGHLLIIDGVTPLLAEIDAMPETPELTRRRRTASARLPMVSARADAVLTASPAQVEWWSDRISGRFGLPFLNVPFGIPDDAPPKGTRAIPSVPSDWAVVLWWGGVWPWLDLDTLLAARARLGKAPVSVVIPTSDRPGRSGPGVTTETLADMTRSHGLKSPQVVALDRWIPYAERHLVLNRASLVAVLHRPGEEASLSFRTRALDAVWAGVPVLLTEGGEAARQARENGWGGVVGPGDPSATASAMDLLLREREQARCRLAISQTRDRWTWSRVTRNLAAALDDLPSVPRKKLLPAAIRSALILCHLRDTR